MNVTKLISSIEENLKAFVKDIPTIIGDKPIDVADIMEHLTEEVLAEDMKTLEDGVEALAEDMKTLEDGVEALELQIDSLKELETGVTLYPANIREQAIIEQFQEILQKAEYPKIENLLTDYDMLY